ncbi:amidohydrolase family protein [Cupriavidus necator]
MREKDLTTYQGSMPRSTAELQRWFEESTSETALEPDLPIVDAHHHLYGDVTDRHYYRRIDLDQDLSSGHRVVGTVYVEAYRSGWKKTGSEPLRPVGEVEMIAEQAAKPILTANGACQIAAGIVAHADLSLGREVTEVLEAHLAAAQGRLRGVRHMTARDDGLVGRFIKEMPTKHLLQDNAFRTGLAQLERYGLSFDVWVYQHQLREVLDVVDQFPGITFVLDHVGGLIGVGEFRERRSEVVSQWQTDLQELARRPNVYVKVGGMGMPVFGFGFEYGARPANSTALAQAWKPLIDACVDSFGPNRCMFESNFPVDKQSCGYTELWNAFKLATLAMSADERAAMFYGTASKVYRLDLPR